MNQRKYRRKFGGKVFELGSTNSVNSKKDRSLSGSKGFFDYVNRKLSPNNFPSFQKLNFSSNAKFNFVPPTSTKREQSPKKYTYKNNQNRTEGIFSSDNFEKDYQLTDNFIKRIANYKGALRQKLQNSAMQKFRQTFNQSNTVSDRLTYEREKVQKNSNNQQQSKKSKQLVKMLEDINKKRLEKQKLSKNEYISFKGSIPNNQQQFAKKQKNQHVKFQESSFSSIDDSLNFKDSKKGPNDKFAINTIDRVSENKNSNKEVNTKTDSKMQKTINYGKNAKEQSEERTQNLIFDKAELNNRNNQKPIVQKQGLSSKVKPRQNQVLNVFQRNKQKALLLSQQQKHKKQFEILKNAKQEYQIQINKVQKKKEKQPKQQAKQLTKKAIPQQKKTQEPQKQDKNSTKKKFKNRFDATDNILDVKVPQVKSFFNEEAKKETSKDILQPFSQQEKEFIKNKSDKVKGDKLLNIQKSAQRISGSDLKNKVFQIPKEQNSKKKKYQDDDDLQEIDFNPKPVIIDQVKKQQNPDAKMKSQNQKKNVSLSKQAAQSNNEQITAEIIDEVYQIADKIDILGEYSNKARGFYSDGKVGVNFKICGYYLAHQFNFYRYIARQILSGEKRTDFFGIEKQEIESVRQQEEIQSLVTELKQEEQKTKGMISKLYSLCKNQLPMQEMQKGLKINPIDNYHHHCLKYLRNQFNQIYPVYMKNNLNVSVGRRCCYIIQVYCLLLQLHGKPVKEFEQPDQIKNPTLHIANNKKLLGL